MKDPNTKSTKEPTPARKGPEQEESEHGSKKKSRHPEKDLNGKSPSAGARRSRVAQKGT